MSRIFISYKRIDKKKVFKLKERIEQGIGEKCWIDLDGIESDAQFLNVIIKAINDCEIVLFMYSKAQHENIDFENDWTIRELNFAKSKGKRIVFINIDGAPLIDRFAFEFGLKQQVDGKDEAAIDHLITDLLTWLNLPAPPPQPFKCRWNRILFFWGAGAAIVAVLLTCLYFMLPKGTPHPPVYEGVELKEFHMEVDNGSIEENTELTVAFPVKGDVVFMRNVAEWIKMTLANQMRDSDYDPDFDGNIADEEYRGDLFDANAMLDFYAKRAYGIKAKVSVLTENIKFMTMTCSCQNGAITTYDAATFRKKDGRLLKTFDILRMTPLIQSELQNAAIQFCKENWGEDEDYEDYLIFSEGHSLDNMPIPEAFFNDGHIVLYYEGYELTSSSRRIFVEIPFDRAKSAFTSLGLEMIE